MAVFGVPTTREDDAARALATAADLQLIVSSWAAGSSGESGADLALHISVHAGEVLVSASRDPGGWSVTGDVVNVASRLCDQAEPSQILVSVAARDLCRIEFGWSAVRELSLRGRREPVLANIWDWQEKSLEPSRPLRWNTSLVDRHQPRSILDAHRASTEGRCLAVVGEPGVGKTRLVLEWCAAQVDCLVIRGRSRAFGASSWWEPLEDALSSLAGDGGLTRLLELARLPAGSAPLLERRWLRMLGDVESTEPDSAADLVSACGEFLSLVGRQTSVILHIDDIHDSGPSLLAALRDFASSVTPNPVIVVMTARPELALEPDVKVLGLQPLPAADGEALIRELLPGLPEGAAARLNERVGGNPYYAEECAQFIRDESYLYPERPTAPDLTLERLFASPTPMRTFVTARLDRLAASERRMLEALCIATDSAPMDLIAKLLGASVASLQVSELVDRGLLTRGSPEDAPRFRHGLTREIVQATMSLQRRSALHELAHEWYQERMVQAGSPRHGLGLAAARAEHSVAAWKAAQTRPGSDCGLALRAVGELLDWSEIVVRLEPGAAQAITLQARDIADAAPHCIDVRLRFRLAEQRAKCAFELGDRAASREFSESARAYAAELDPLSRMQAELLGARLMSEDGDEGAARRLLVDLVDRSRRLGAAQLHVDILYALARISEDALLGKTAFAAVYDAADRVGDDGMRSLSALQAATMSLLIDAADAESWLERAEALQLPSDLVGRAQSHVSRAWLAILQDRFVEAQGEADAALALGRGGQAWQVEAFAALLAAEAALRLGDLALAEHHVESIIDRVRSRGRAKGLLGVAAIQTCVAALAGDPAGAALILAEAQAYDRPDVFEAGTLDSILGLVLLWRGDAAAAVAPLARSEKERRGLGHGLSAVAIGLNRLRAISLQTPAAVAAALPEFLDYAGAANATYALAVARLIAAHADAVSGGPITDVDDPGFEGSEPVALLAEMRAIDQARRQHRETAATLQTALDAWTVLGYTAWRARCGFWLAEVTGEEHHAATARGVLGKVQSPVGLEEMFRSQWRAAQAGRT